MEQRRLEFADATRRSLIEALPLSRRVRDFLLAIDTLSREEEFGMLEGPHAFCDAPLERIAREMRRSTRTVRYAIREAQAVASDYCSIDPKSGLRNLYALHWIEIERAATGAGSLPVPTASVAATGLGNLPVPTASVAATGLGTSSHSGDGLCAQNDGGKDQKHPGKNRLAPRQLHPGKIAGVNPGKTRPAHPMGDPLLKPVLIPDLNTNPPPLPKGGAGGAAGAAAGVFFGTKASLSASAPGRIQPGAETAGADKPQRPTLVSEAELLAVERFENNFAIYQADPRTGLEDSDRDRVWLGAFLVCLKRERRQRSGTKREIRSLIRLAEWRLFQGRAVWTDGINREDRERAAGVLGLGDLTRTLAELAMNHEEQTGPIRIGKDP